MDKIVYILDDNKMLLKEFERVVFENKQLEKIHLKTFQKPNDLYRALKENVDSEAIILLDTIIGKATAANILEDIKDFEENNEIGAYRVWLFTGQTEADVTQIITRFGIEKNWFAKPADPAIILSTILEIEVLPDDEVTTLLRRALLENPKLKARVINHEGKILNSYGILSTTNDSQLRKEVFDRAKNEGAYSEDRLLIIPTEGKETEIEYTETINLSDGEKYLMQLFLSKETPTYNFKDSEAFFKDFAQKVLHTLRFIGFTRARLYTVKYIREHTKVDNGIEERMNKMYFAQAMVGHTQEEEKKFEGRRHLCTEREKAIMTRMQKKFAEKKHSEEFIYEIVPTKKNDSPWYDMLDGDGYSEYLYVPIFDKEGNVIMALTCDRYGITERGASDFTDTSIRKEEIESASSILLRATDLMRNEYWDKRSKFYEKYQTRLLRRLANITLKDMDDEKEILSSIISELASILQKIDKKLETRPSLEAMWILEVENDVPEVIADFGTLPNRLKRYRKENYNLINKFLKFVSPEQNKLDIAKFDDRCTWKEYVNSLGKPFDNEQQEWYDEGFKSLHFRAIYVDNQLKAILIFYSKDPYYLSAPKDMLVDIAVEKCQLTLEVHAKFKEKMMFSRELVHDFRSPITTMRHHIDKLRDNDDSPLANDFERTLDEMEENVEDILMFSKLEHGRVNIEKTEIILEEFFEEMRKKFKTQAEHKRLNLLLKIDGATPVTFESDERLLKHILHNLLSNAVKYTSKGEVSLQALMNSDGFVVFCVEDTGEGIEKFQKDTIFDFYSNTDNEYKNTGMGLHIVKKLVEILEFDITVESQEDKGSIFCIETAIETTEKTHEKPIEQSYEAYTYDRKVLDKHLRSLGEEMKLVANIARRKGTKASYRAFIEKLKEALKDEYPEFIEQLYYHLENLQVDSLDAHIRTITGGDHEQ